MAAHDHSRGAVESVLITVLALFAGFATAADITTPVIPDSVVIARDRAIDRELTGVVQIAVEPPFPDALVTISIDGQAVGKQLGPPYRLEVDFGPRAVEHEITISSVNSRGSGKTSFSRIVNRGLRSLAVDLKEADSVQHVFEAVITAPESDPVRRVEFYDQEGLLSRLEAPPYRVQVQQKSLDGLIRVTATTASGAEVTDFFTRGGAVHTASYDVRTVDLLVSVVDRQGMSRGDLAPSRFRVLDNGAPGKILNVGKAGSEPISLALLMDASASMSPHIASAREAAADFIERIVRPDDRVSFFAIQTVPRRQLAIGGDPAQARLAISRTEPSGDTALYDSIRAAMRELKDERRRRAIVVLSDGADTASMSTYEEVLKETSASNIPVYIIAFGEAAAGRGDVERLRYLSSQTGAFLIAANATSLRDSYKAIEQDLREQYSIRYQIADVSRSNEWRQVKVVLNMPTLEARTIRGYFTP